MKLRRIGEGTYRIKTASEIIKEQLIALGCYQAINQLMIELHFDKPNGIVNRGFIQGEKIPKTINGAARLLTRVLSRMIAFENHMLDTMIGGADYANVLAFELAEICQIYSRLAQDAYALKGIKVCGIEYLNTPILF